MPYCLTFVLQRTCETYFWFTSLVALYHMWKFLWKGREGYRICTVHSLFFFLLLAVYFETAYFRSLNTCIIYLFPGVSVFGSFLPGILLRTTNSDGISVHLCNATIIYQCNVLLVIFYYKKVGFIILDFLIFTRCLVDQHWDLIKKLSIPLIWHLYVD